MDQVNIVTSAVSNVTDRIRDAAVSIREAVGLAEKGSGKLHDVTSTSILRKIGVFSEFPLNLGKCRAAAIQVCRGIAREIEFTDSERSDIFFGLTHLFNTKDRYLHRVLLLLLRYVQVNRHESVIVMHSLAQDIASGEPLFQAYAIRTLVSAVEPSLVLSLERHLKAMIVAKNSFVPQAVLAAVHPLITGGGRATLQRWAPEIRQALSAESAPTRYHAALFSLALREDSVRTILSQPQTVLEGCLAFAVGKGDAAAARFQAMPVRLEAARSADTEIGCAIVREFLSGQGVRPFAGCRVVMRAKDATIYRSLLPKILSFTAEGGPGLAPVAILAALRLAEEAEGEILGRRVAARCRSWPTSVVVAVADGICGYVARLQCTGMLSAAVELMRCAGTREAKMAVLNSLCRTVSNDLAMVLGDYLEDWDSSSVARGVCDFFAAKAPELDPQIVVKPLVASLNLDLAVRSSAMNALVAVGMAHNLRNEIKQIITAYGSDGDDVSFVEMVERYCWLLDSEADFSWFSPLPSPGRTKEPKELEPVSEIPAVVAVDLGRFGESEWRSEVIDIGGEHADVAVRVFQNVFKDVIVFEFLATSNVQELELEDVTVELRPSTLVVERTNTPKVTAVITGQFIVVIRREGPRPELRFDAILLFKRDQEPDELSLEPLVVVQGCWFHRAIPVSFEDLWREKAANECQQIFKLQYRSVPEGRDALVAALQMICVSEVQQEKKIVLQFAGLSENGDALLVVAHMGMSGRQVALKIIARASDVGDAERVVKRTFQ